MNEWRRGPRFEHSYRRDLQQHVEFNIVIMTSSNGNIFRVTGPLCGEFTGLGEFPTQRPVTRSFDVFFDLCLNKRLSKQSWGWWFETLSWSLWRHSNGTYRKIITYRTPSQSCQGKSLGGLFETPSSPLWHHLMGFDSSLCTRRFSRQEQISQRPETPPLFAHKWIKLVRAIWHGIVTLAVHSHMCASRRQPRCGRGCPENENVVPQRYDTYVSIYMISLIHVARFMGATWRPYRPHEPCRL